MENVIKATYQGTITLNNTELKVGILENGKKVVYRSSIYKLFNKTKRGRVRKDLKSKKRLTFVNTELLKKYIDDNLDNTLKTIKFKSERGKIIEAYDADAIPNIANLYINTEKKIKLPPNQASLIEPSKQIINSLSGRDIKLIITEELNYSFTTEIRVLLKTLKPQFEPTIYNWLQVFPVSFFHQLYRLNNWEFIETEIISRPSILTKWINNLVFERLPEDVLNDLNNTKPKLKLIKSSDQLITENIGNSHLKGQINQVMTMFLISSNMKEMWLNFKKVYFNRGKIIQSPFLFNTKGCTIEPIEKVFLSDFNKKLQIALNYNPRLIKEKV
jgi:hypothetical protein